MDRKEYQYKTDVGEVIVGRSNGSATGDQFINLFAQSGARQNSNKSFCNDWLVKNFNVKIIHPDDGWVKRHENPQYFHPCYPSVHRAIKEGDLMAFGSPTCDGIEPTERFPNPYAGDYRIVRMTGFKSWIFQMPGEDSKNYFFEQLLYKFRIYHDGTMEFTEGGVHHVENKGRMGIRRTGRVGSRRARGV